MEFKKTFRRVGSAFLAAAMLAPTIPVLADDGTYDLVVTLHYQNLEDSLDANAEQKTYEGIEAIEDGDKYNVTDATAQYLVKIPDNNEAYDLLKAGGITCQKYDKSSNTYGEAQTVDFNALEGVAITQEDAKLARNVTKDNTQGDGEYAGQANAIHLHYDRNIYSLFVDANGGKLADGIDTQYDFFYGEDFDKSYGGRESVKTVMQKIWDSQPQKGVRNPDGSIQKDRQDKFVDWRVECRTKDKMYVSPCTEVDSSADRFNNVFDKGLNHLNSMTANTMPATDIVMRAHWRNTEAPVTVIYNLQNADDNNYSVIGKDTIYMPVGMRVINNVNKYHHNGEEKKDVINTAAEYELKLTAESGKIVSGDGAGKDGIYNVHVTGKLGDMSEFLLTFPSLDATSGSASKTLTAVTGISDKEGHNSNVELNIEVTVDKDGKPAVSLKDVRLQENGADGFTSRYSKVEHSDSANPERADMAQQTYTLSFSTEGKDVYPIETDLYNLENKLTDATAFADKDYFSFYYCDAYQELNNDGTVKNKLAKDITTVDYEGNTVVNVYYTRNYYALQFHLSREIIGKYVDVTDKLPGSNTSYQQKGWDWGVTGRAWAFATLTRSRHGYISTGKDYDWRKEGSTDPYNRLGNYDAFGSDDGIFSWGPNMADKPWNPNYAFFDDTGSKPRPSIQIGGVKSEMGPIRKIAGSNPSRYEGPAEQTEYTIIARYGASISDYWPTGNEKVLNATGLPTWDKYNDGSPGLFNDAVVVDGQKKFKRYSFYSWQTNYDTLFHASRIDVQDVYGKYSSLDKNMIVQEVTGDRVDRAPQASSIPTPQPGKPALSEVEENSSEEFTMPEDIFTPESMDQEVNLGAEGEIEDFVVDENEMPDGSHFDPSELETPNDNYGTVTNEYVSLSETTPVPDLAVDSTTAREVVFKDKEVPDKPVYLATPKEGLKVDDDLQAQAPVANENEAATAEIINIDSIGYKHDLFAFWNPTNRNWKHTCHYLFEDPNANTKSGDTGKLTIEEDAIKWENVPLAESNGGARDIYWRHFPASYVDSVTGNTISMSAADQYRLKYSGDNSGAIKPDMPEGFDNPYFVEKEKSQINTVEPNVSQNAQALKGYRLYYIGHVKKDDRRVRPDGSEGDDIYMFYVPERYTVNYVTYPGQPKDKQMKKTVKYDQNISEEMNLAPREMENGVMTNEDYVQLTTFGQECTFAGWYYDPGYTKPVDFSDPNVKYEGGVTYYGKWNPPTHTVTFMMNGFKMTDTLTADLKTKFGVDNVKVDNDKVVVKNVPNGTKAEDILMPDYESYITTKKAAVNGHEAANVELRFNHWVDYNTNKRYGFGASQYITEDLTVKAETLDDRGYVCYILRHNQDIALYTSVNAALKAYSDSDYKIVMLMDTKEDIDIKGNLMKDAAGNSCREKNDVLLDFHGYTIEGNVKVDEGYHFYGIDTATDKFGLDYGEKDLVMGGAYGGLIGNVVDGNGDKIKPEDNIDDLSKITGNKTASTMEKTYTYDYVSYQELNGWSFHRVYSDVWADVVKINSDNSASITFVTGYYGDAKAKDLLTGEGKENLSAKYSDGLTPVSGKISGGSEAFMGVNFYKATVKRNSSEAEEKFLVMPTITNADGVIEGTDNTWLRSGEKIAGYSIIDAMRMIVNRYGKDDTIGFGNNDRYLGDVTQYSDYSDSDSNMNKNKNNVWYTQKDIDQVKLWLGRVNAND